MRAADPVTLDCLILTWLSSIVLACLHGRLHLKHEPTANPASVGARLFRLYIMRRCSSSSSGVISEMLSSRRHIRQCRHHPPGTATPQAEAEMEIEIVRTATPISPDEQEVATETNRT